MKSILKVFLEIFYAIITRKQLGSTFSRRLKFIRCNYELQKEIKKKCHIEESDEE